MIHITGKKIEQDTFTAVTLGNFDGLHLGHQKLIQTVKESGYKSVVFSFTPHPVSVIKKRDILTITTGAEKSFLLESFGVDMFVEYPFDESFQYVEPEYFIKNILFDELKCKLVVVGEEYRFGKRQKGNARILTSLGRELGFEVKIIPHVMMDGSKVSSSTIREMIEANDFQKAAQFLGRPYFVLGQVVTGRKIGRTMNFPTVNILPPKAKLLPGNGVYCTRVKYGGKLWEGVTNIGYNPTIGNEQKTIETFIFELNKEIYGEQTEVYFYKWLRDEIKFDNINVLKDQIASDVKKAREYFGL